MASLQDYLNQLEQVYAPQKGLINQQVQGLDPYYNAMIQGLEATKTRAFGDIVQGANRRGVAYSGIPIEQQSQYVGEKYLPALAGLQQEKLGARTKLQQMLAELDAQKYKEAHGMYGEDQDREAKERQAQQQLALQRSTSARTSARSTRKPTQAELRSKAKQEISGDILGFYQAGRHKSQWATEKELIPALTQYYPELTQKEINDLVYTLRKSYE